MINRSPSPSKLQSGTNSTNQSNQLQSQPESVQYFNQVPDNQPKSGYANQASQINQANQAQAEIAQGLPGYAEKGKSGYYNQDVLSTVIEGGYANKAQDANLVTNESGYENEGSYVVQNISAPVANQAQLLDNLVIEVKGKSTSDPNSSFKVCSLLSQEEAALIEQQCGVVLKKDTSNPDQFNGFLGGGAFGKVYVAREENTNPAKYVAIKIVQGDQRALVESKHESGLQLKLTEAVNRDDSQLMPIIGIGENINRTVNEAEKFYIVMPLAGMGSGEGLRKDLNELKKSNTSTEFYRLLNLHIAKSMLIGLHQMHRNHIYHLDLKPANMMITGDGRIQLSDFGTSEEVMSNPPSFRVGKDQQSGRFIGNGDRTYFPQERTFDEGSSFDPAKADIYAAGLVLWEFLTGEEFSNHNPLSNPIFNNVVKDSLEELTLRLLNPQAASRISLEDALNHPCLTVAEAHDESVNKVVLGFLGNYVKYTQSKARGDVGILDQLSQSLKDDLDKSQLQTESLNALPGVVTNSNDPFTLNPTIKIPFANRSEIKEQLQTYLPLKCSQVKTISDSEKQTFSLIDRANKFLANPNTALLLLLADGGAGKSLFVQWLVTNILEQKSPYDEIKSPNSGKPYFPLYVTLSNLKNLDKIFEQGLNLTQESVHELQKTHQVLLILDGFDEQSYQWKNLYSENKLYNYPGLKIIVTSRINALPGSYSEYFVARQNDGKDLGYQELYLQPFQASQIDTYVANYISQHKASIQQQVEQKQLPPQWLEAKYVQEQINSIPGLKELMQTPLLSRLVLIALPELNKQQTQTTSRKITRVQVYEAFMRQWIITQIRKNNTINPDAKPKEIAITDDKINQILDFGEKIALTMYRDNRAAQLMVGLQTFSFNSSTGKYHLNPSQYSWFEQGKLEQTLLPLQEVQKGTYKFVHLSMQEYLLARHLINELSQTSTLVNLMFNQVTLTLEEKDRPILYFMGDMATMSKVVADKLFALINQTKTIKSQGIAGANAISVLNASEVSLTSRDFSNTYLPNSDLSGGTLMYTNFSNANLSNINLQGSKLNNTSFTKANLAGLRLGQYPMYLLETIVSVLCYSPDGRYLAIGQNKELILFNAYTRKKIRHFKGHTNEIMSVSFSGDGKRVATGSNDNTARIYDAESGECLKVLMGHTNRINSVSFSGDGKRVATGSSDETVRIYDVVSGKCVKVLDVYTSEIYSVSFSADGKRVATGSNDNTARIYNAESGECLKVLVGHTSEIYSVSFSVDGKRVATGGGLSDNTARIYDAESGECLKVLDGHTEIICSVSFSVDGKRVVTGSNDNTARIYDAESGACLKVLVGHTNQITSVSFSVDGKRVATGSCDKTVRIYDTGSSDCLKVMMGHTDQITSVSFSVDGKRVATGSRDKTVWIYDTENGECLKVLDGHTESIMSVNFSRDSKRVATGSFDKTARIYDAESGECLKVLDGHTDWISSVSFSGDGKQVATGSKDCTVRIYGAVSGECLKVLEGHTRSIESMNFSVDGAMLLTRDIGGIEKMWSVSSGKELKFDNTFTAWNAGSTRSLDNVSVEYNKKTVNLKQEILRSGVPKSKTEELSLSFPSNVRDVSLSKSITGNEIILMVVYGEGIAFYSKALESLLSDFTVFRASTIDQSLDGSGMDLSNTENLSESNYEVLEQLGAKGAPRAIVGNEQSSNVVENQTKSKTRPRVPAREQSNILSQALSKLFKKSNIKTSDDQD